MNPINASTERFEAVEILTVPGLFTTQRVDRATVPSRMYLYEMQTNPEDWGQPCLLGRHVTSEHFGTVFTASPLPLPPGGYVDLAPGDFDERQGLERLTAAEFEAKYLDPNYQPPRQAVPHHCAARTKRAPRRGPVR